MTTSAAARSAVPGTNAVVYPLVCSNACGRAPCSLMNHAARRHAIGAAFQRCSTAGVMHTPLPTPPPARAPSRVGKRAVLCGQTHTCTHTCTHVIMYTRVPFRTALCELAGCLLGGGCSAAVAAHIQGQHFAAQVAALLGRKRRPNSVRMKTSCASGAYVLCACVTCMHMAVADRLPPQLNTLAVHCCPWHAHHSLQVVGRIIYTIYEDLCNTYSRYTHN